MIQEIISKKIGVFGFGLEGQSTYRYLSKLGAKDVEIFDEKKKSSRGVAVNTGVFEDNDYSNIDIAFRSPGIKPERLRKILPKSTVITSQANYFMENAKGKKVLITGTKGKSTTANIIFQIYKDLGKDVYVGGNIGNPLLDIIGDLGDNSITIIELSSFQLQDFSGGGDDCIILPIKVDHLDYHASEREYHLAKSNVLKEVSKSGVIVVPSPNDFSLNSSNVFYYSLSSPVESGCYLKGGDLSCIGLKEVNYHKLENMSKKYKVPLVNLVAVCTYVFSKEINIDLQDILKNYEKPKFRVELVSEKDNLRFYNDSAATNPISTIEATKMMDSRYCLIMGGSSKSLDYNGLAKVLKNSDKLVRVYIFGQTAVEIKKSLSEQGFDKEIFYKNNLEEIIEDIAHNKGRFDIVLFSPASASFDQFENYRERGKYFNDLIRGI